MLTKHQYNTLINIENVSTDLLRNNLVRTREDFSLFSDVSKGLPILIPADPEIFDFKECDTFYLSDNEIMELYYGKVDLNYTGFKLSFSKNLFLSVWNIKKNFTKALSDISSLNSRATQKIQNLKTNFKNIAAFQTRNIPHFGHEAIMEKILSKCDHLVINPVIGPKKTGDLTTQALSEVYNYLASKKYENRISFIPIYAQMFYAGPREAIHHALLRQQLGFTNFTVGRDHAGSDGFYHPLEASEVIKKNKDKFKISVYCHSGAFFCNTCNKPIIANACCHDKAQLIDISGTELRDALKRGAVYKYADLDMQNFIKQKKLELFEK